MYETQATVLALLGRNGELSASTTPTLTEAASIQAGITAEIDAALSAHGLTVPVTTPASLVKYLRVVESWGACSSILKTRFQDTSGPNSEASWALFETRYQRAMDRLWDGALVDELGGEDALPTSYFVENPDEELDLGDIAEPVFTSDCEL